MSETQVSQTTTSQREPGREQRIFTFKATYVIWLLLVMLLGLLAIRVGLKLIGANPDNPFTALIYGLSGLFVFPFAGIVGTPSTGGMELEISSIIAMVVYALLGWLFERVIWVIFYRPREATVAVTQQSTTEQHTH